MATDVLLGGAIIILSLLGGMAAILFLLIWLKSHRLRVRDPSKRHSYITDYWMLEKRDKKTGSVWWVAFSNKKVRIPEPPADCIDVGKRGRKYVECYRMSEDEYAFINDEGLSNSKSKIIQSFKPFDVVQRQVIVSQFTKAEELKAKNFVKENLVPMTAILALVVIIIMLIVFWGDIAKPALESHSLALKTQEQNIQIMHQLGIASGNNQLPQTIQAANQGGVTTPDEKPPTNQ